MTGLPLYNMDQQWPSEPSDTGHRGLWFDRFFNQYNNQWLVKDEAKKIFLSTLSKTSCGDKGTLNRVCDQQMALTSSLAGQYSVYKSDWHWVSGMGLDHPVENGFSWHSTLGTPYIPGSGVKGLVRAYMEQQGCEGTDLQRFFGSDHKLPEQQQHDQQAGEFMFFDAIPTDVIGLSVDVMTPHMGKWYEQSDDASAVPADWHSPVPVCFLTAKQANLLFSISPRPGVKTQPEDLDRLFEALTNALDLLGVGGKTAVGYGYMQEDAAANTKLQQRQEEKIKQQEIDKLSPGQRELLNAEMMFDVPDQLKPGSSLGGLINDFLNTATDWPSEDAAAAAVLAKRYYDLVGWGKKDKKKQRKERIAILSEPKS
ncbi:MAG: type III-B CRISPR module RAMP protein Cmr6 [Motiliproteus sp.]